MTFSDMKNRTSTIPVIYYLDSLTIYDYYPFGMLKPGRYFEGLWSRYGFNGMEKDDDVKGKGNSYDFGARVYDPRTIRWFSLDGLKEMYPDLSPYISFANNPLLFIDPDGNYLKPIIWENRFGCSVQRKTFGDLTGKFKTGWNSLHNVNPGNSKDQMRISGTRVNLFTSSLNVIDNSKRYFEFGFVDKRYDKTDPLYKSFDKNDRGMFRSAKGTDEDPNKMVMTNDMTIITIFEETFHAAQYDYYKSKNTLVNKITNEVEAKVAEAYQGLIKEGNIGYDWYNKNSTIIEKHFDNITQGIIDSDTEQKFMTSLYELGKEVYDVYKYSWEKAGIIKENTIGKIDVTLEFFTSQVSNEKK